jgi:hypothetical protein
LAFKNKEGKNTYHWSDMVVHPCNPRTQEADVGES